MCTVVLLLRPGHSWPILLAANRDEMLDRPWRSPGPHWPDRPGVIAGLDLLAGGSWLGVNAQGVVAAILNRPGSLGPARDKRSRGELVLEALDHPDASAAAGALSALDPRSYRSFNMVIGDNAGAYWLRHRGGEGPEDRIERFALPPGFSMITAHDRNDMSSARIRTYLPRFEAAPPPDPERGDWKAWETLLAGRGTENTADGEGAMSVMTDFGFGTSSSSLIALPAPAYPPRPPVWLFAAGPPGETAYEPVSPASMRPDAVV